MKENATHFIQVWEDKEKGKVVSDSGDPLPISDYSFYGELTKSQPHLDPICVFWIKPLQEPTKQTQ